MAGDGPQLSFSGASARAADPDRFEAALFEEDAALRERLFTLIALNAELARTRLRVTEAQIGLIRLQWWRDVVEEALTGAPARAHELAGPVHAMVAAAPEGFGAELIDLIDAWERDLDPAPFADLYGLILYLDATAGRMMRLGGRLALGRKPDGGEEAALSSLGLADGAARALAATPALAAQNRSLLPLEGPALASLLRGAPDEAAREAAQALARAGLTALARGETAAKALPGEAQARLKPVLLAAWRARRILTRAARPGCDLMRDLGPESPFRRRASLLWRGILGRF